MRIALYGGSFDPFHEAHLAVVEALLKAMKLDQLIVMPAGSAPHKPPLQASFATYRYRMCELALEDNKKVHVDDWEIRRAEPSYTVDTLQMLHEREPKAELYLVMGADMLMSFRTWFHYREILELATLLVLERPGFDREGLESMMESLKAQEGAKLQLIKMKQVDLSSTEIRAEIRGDRTRNEPWTQDLPKPVRAFIQTHQLYVKDALLADFSDDEIRQLRSLERVLMGRISYRRLVHSLDVMYEAVAIARRFGVHAFSAAIAGLTHDIAKEEPMARQQAWALAFDPQAYTDEPIAHSAAASYVLAHELGIDDRAILRAIQMHSTLSPDPEPLELVLYLADKIEPGRDYADLTLIRKKVQSSLEEACCLVIEGQEVALARQGQTLKPETQIAYQRLKERVSEMKGKQFE